MKSFALLVAAGVALAQDLGSLPQCGQTCISNMLAIAQSQFGCAQGDAVCYCTQPRFGYGVRDCSNEACASADDAAKVISFGTSYCESLAASASSPAAISTGALGILSSALATATPTGGSDQSTLTTVTGTPTGGAAASSAASSAESALSSATGSAASALSSLSASASSAASSLASAASSVAGSLSSELSSATGAAGSAASSLASSATGGAESSGLAPRMTGVPVAGALGVAAMLLL